MTDTNTAQMADDLTSTNNAVLGKGWVSPGLSGTGGPLDLLGSMGDPLSGLASAGLGWFTSFVSFLGDGLTQLQGGNSASVSSGSQDFTGAGQDINDVANSYGNSTTQQTTSWSGPAASDYRSSAAQHATGVTGLGNASTTVGSSILGAGQVVAQAISDITELIGEAVGQIVPIMTQAIARAQQTMGESVVEAIPPCVGIAVEYALRIAAKLAALLASGQNLLKLVQGASGIVDLLQQAMSSISQQGSQGGTGSDQSQSTSPASTPSSSSLTGPTLPSSSDGSDSGSSDGSDSGSGDGGDGSDSSGDVTGPDLSGADLSGSDGSGDGSTDGSSDGIDPGLDTAPYDGTQSSAVNLPQNTTPDASAYQAHSDAGQSSAGAMPVSAAGMGLVAGARSGAAQGADTVRSGGRRSTATTAKSSGTPGTTMGGMGSAAGGDKDKDHKRKYDIVQKHDEAIDIAPAVITTSSTME